MKKSFFVSLISALVLFTACSKSDDKPSINLALLEEIGYWNVDSMVYKSPGSYESFVADGEETIMMYHFANGEVTAMSYSDSWFSFISSEYRIENGKLVIVEAGDSDAKIIQLDNHRFIVETTFEEDQQTYSQTLYFTATTKAAWDDFYNAKAPL